MGPRGKEGCYWNRASKPSGDLEDIIEVGKVDDSNIGSSGTARITLHSSEWFIYWGCYPSRTVPKAATRAGQGSAGQEAEEVAVGVVGRLRVFLRTNGACAPSTSATEWS